MKAGHDVKSSVTLIHVTNGRTRLVVRDASDMPRFRTVYRDSFVSTCYVSLMTQQHRPPKRPRTAADDGLKALTHHEEFWLDDGNVVLVAQTVAFRMYRGLLAAQSTVFADMFASSTHKADEMIEGCPVVRVSDSPEDLAQLFRVILPTTHRRCVHSRNAVRRHANALSYG